MLSLTYGFPGFSAHVSGESPARKLEFVTLTRPTLASAVIAACEAVDAIHSETAHVFRSPLTEPLPEGPHDIGGEG
jgi:hypothetical protein